MPLAGAACLLTHQESPVLNTVVRDYVSFFPLPEKQPCLGLPQQCHAVKFFLTPEKDWP